MTPTKIVEIDQETTSAVSEISIPPEIIFSEPTVNDSYKFEGDRIEFNQNGYKVNKVNYSVEKTYDISLIKFNRKSSIITMKRQINECLYRLKQQTQTFSFCHFC